MNEQKPKQKKLIFPILMSKPGTNEIAIVESEKDLIMFSEFIVVKQNLTDEEIYRYIVDV